MDFPKRPGQSTAAFSLNGSDVRISVRLMPGSSRNGIERIEADAARTCRLRVRVTAVPEGGRANAALIKLVAKTWRLPASSITLASGARDRNKVLLLRGAGPEGLRRLEDWAARTLGNSSEKGIIGE